MKKYITGEDRENIVNKLVDDKYKAVIKELNEAVGNALHDALVDMLPEYIREYLDIADINEVRSYFKVYNSCNAYRWYSSENFMKFCKTIEDRTNAARLMNYLNKLNNVHFSFEHHVPYGGPYQLMFIEAFICNENLRETFYKYAEKVVEQNELREKIDCLLRSKRFTVELLKNEFPEAFKAYTSIDPNKAKYVESNMCDNVENVRAILNSKKV